METTQHNHTHADTCFECAEACERCATACLEMHDSDSKGHDMTACIKLCRDCADFCTMCGRLDARGSEFSRDFMVLCAEVCEACAEECENTPVTMHTAKPAPKPAVNALKSVGQCRQARNNCRKCPECSDISLITLRNNSMHLVLLLLLIIHWLTGPDPVSSKQIGVGIHPAVATDPAGRVHVVYGKGNAIFYTMSNDGDQFNTPVQVDSLAGLHLGASRGPQIAATAKSAVITAIDKAGNVWAYSLNRATGQWQPRVRVTDVPDIAKEGFVALSADADNGYNAVWLDLRTDKRNKIVGARSTDGGRTWSANQAIYQSPHGTVCECCQPSVVSQGKHVAIMFRNFLNGSRDMYLLQSRDGGRTFGKAEKLGQGTWKLNACPMDGGGLSMTSNGAVATVWRRENKLFAARPGQPETEVGEGKNAKIVSTKKGDYVVFQQAGQVMAIVPGESQPKMIAPGGYPKLALLPDDRVLCLWEQNGAIWAQII